MSIIGIDFGTTNYCVSVIKEGKLIVIPNSEGAEITPSVVAFTKSGEILVGEMARRQAITNPERTFESIIRDTGIDRSIEIDNKYTYLEIIVMIFKKLKKDAEDYLGEAITQAVITIPAYLSYAQIQLIKNAARIAGIEILRYITSSVAASLAYGFDKIDKYQKILVYDFGGATFDVSILDFGDGVFDVLSTNGDTKLGGDDFDERIMNFIADTFKADNAIDLMKDKIAARRLKDAAEKAKIELSSSTQTNISLPYITTDANGPKHINLILTRSKFNEITNDLVQKSIELMNKALDEAKLSIELMNKNLERAGIPLDDEKLSLNDISDIDKVILIGGSTRIPEVQEAVKKFIGKEPSRIVNPDECVAVGAAIQAAVLTGEVKDIVLLDVTSLSLGIETKGGVFKRMIRRNTTIPTKASIVLSTTTDNQTSIIIHVLRGEHEMAEYNETLGIIKISGILPAPKGIAKIEVSLDIDANGIVYINVIDFSNGKTYSEDVSCSDKQLRQGKYSSSELPALLK